MPIARPADANSARNEVVSIPKKLTTMMIRIKDITALSIDSRKVLSEASTSRRTNIRRTNPMIRRMINRPI